MMGRFAGDCLGGPYDGKAIVQESAEFEVLQPGVIGMDQIMASDPIITPVPLGSYRWSEVAGRWMWWKA